MAELQQGKSGVSGFLIERTAKQLKRAFQQTLQQINAGITADQWVVLHLLYREGDGISQYVIAERTVKDPPTVTRIIDLLGKKNLVRREQDPGDRRKLQIYLTAQGKAKVNKLIPQVMEFRLQHFEGLTEKDVNDLVRIMERITQNIHSTQTA